MSIRFLPLFLALLAAGCGLEDPSSTSSNLAGHNCASNADCGPGGHCLGLADAPTGVCTVPASGPCADDGSSGECPSGSRCWMTKAGDPMCWADCGAGCGSAGRCDEDGSCVPKAEANTHCECSCRCSSCTATGSLTCSGGGSACASCASACSDICATSPGCGSYLSSGGSCS